MVNLKLLRSFINLTWLALCIILVLLSSPLWNHQSAEMAEEEVKVFCGNYTPVSDADYESFVNGKQLFKRNCATCHNKNLRDDLTGPALGGLADRWLDYPEADLYRWIRNSQAMILEGHPRALSLWQDWGPTVMSNFPNLTDEEITDLLVYIEAGG